MSQLLTLVSPSGLIDLALKSAAVMLLALVVVVLLRHASASRRHLVWCLSVASLLVLPILALTLPAWQVTWLPRWTVEPTQLAVTRLTTNHTKLLDATPMTETILPSSVTPVTTEPRPSPPAAISTISPAADPFPWLAIGWGAGMLLSLIPLGVGLWQLATLHRRSQVINDPRWLDLLGELRRQLPVRRNVQLRQSTADLAPLTWGALRPVLLVPAEANAWSDERRRLVLLHELAHVRRWDWLTQLVAHVACTVYWFNPLVWWAARQMRIERERACDDLVLASGARASDYAQELLALAAGLSESQVSALVAVPMARHGALEDRLRGILDNRRQRAALTRTAVSLGVTLAVAAITPLAMLRAAALPPTQSVVEQPKPADTAPSPVDKPTEKPVEKPAEADAAPRKDPLLGKESADRIKQFPPSFSKAQEGIEIGISLASDRKVFRLGERVPLDLVIRNVSQKTLHVEHALYPPETPPTVLDANGKRMSIDRLLLLGAIRLYRDILKPNEVAVYRHMGLGVGETPEPPGTFWHPFLKTADVVPGKYRLSQQVHVSVHEDGVDTGGAALNTTTGEVKFEIALGDRANANSAPAEKLTERPADEPIKVRGKVVDDVTGKPIERIVIQAGRVESGDLQKVTWGYSEYSSSSPEGAFTYNILWGHGWTGRVVADGYIPQPILTSAPPADKTAIEVSIRLKRGAIVRGVVLDHAGQPLKAAAVFAVGPIALNLAAGQAWTQESASNVKNESAQRAVTDERGRFELPLGGAKALAVTHATLDAWCVPVPDGGEVTIKLPEPARVDVDLDIDGADKESVIFYQCLTHLMGPEFTTVRVARNLICANPGKLSLASLTPGKYQLVRKAATGAMLERHMFELQPGETKSIDYIREKGARVRGKVTWPANTKLDSVIVAVRSEKSVKSPFDNYEFTTTYASHGVGEDGKFLTERLAPGKYVLEAYAFSPLTDKQRFRTGAIAPSHHAASVNIEVPDNGEFAVPDLVLKPR